MGSPGTSLYVIYFAKFAVMAFYIFYLNRSIPKEAES
jgi:hypothetical protein